MSAAAELFERLVAAEVIPMPFELGEFRRRADAYRGRAVRLIEQPAEFWADESGCGGGLYAMTFPAGEVDIMIIRADGERMWREHCIGHEYGHLLLNHDPRGQITVEQVERLFGSLFTDPAAIRDMLVSHQRADLSVEVERQAEEFAELLAFAPRTDAAAASTRNRYGFTPGRGRTD